MSCIFILHKMSNARWEWRQPKQQQHKQQHQRKRLRRQYQQLTSKIYFLIKLTSRVSAKYILWMSKFYFYKYYRELCKLCSRHEIDFQNSMTCMQRVGYNILFVGLAANVKAQQSSITRNSFHE